MEWQLEHHLFPTMPRYRYEKLAPVLKAFADENNLDYRVSGDHGTLPSSYPELPAELTEAEIEQAQALYPACRDAKAAIRWINATADDYSISTDHIAVIGGSAGSVLAVGLGVSDQDDCTDEISVDDDPTLSTTNLDQSSEVATVIDHWGGTAGVLRSKRCAPSVHPLDPRFPARSAHAVHGRSLLIFHLLINKFTLATVLRVILIADLAAARAAAPLGARET